MARKVLVTGASSGIGQATTRRLLDDGHAVVGVARDFRKFPCNHSEFRSVELDLEDIDTLPDLLKKLVVEYADLDAIVFNAGRGRFGGLEEFSYEQIRALVDLNFLSHAYLARAFSPALRKMGRADFIFVGSEAALAGKRYGAVYCASKFAVRGFAQALREEFASSGVRVCLINPGMVRTPFFDGLDFAPGDEPANYVLPEDVAEVISLVLSSRPETTFDEINLSPLVSAIQFRKRVDS